MEKKWYGLFAMEGVAAGVCFYFLGPEGADLMAALAQPLIWLGRGLRELSLWGGFGNVLAWILYLGLSLAPLFLLAVRLVRKKARWEDGTLAVLSGVLAWGLYYLINPTRLPSAFAGTAMAGFQCACCIWSALLCWVLLEALSRQGKPERLLKVLLNLAGALTVFAAFGLGVGDLLGEMEDAARGNTLGDLTVTNGFLILRCIYGCFAAGLDLWVIRGGLDLVDGLTQDPFSQGTLDGARELVRRGKTALKLAVLGALALNLMQILAGKALYRVRLDLNLPLGSMILILAGILLGSLLQRSKALKDDSDLFV